MKSMLAKKPKPRRIIGIDFGMARIGIAVSDESKTIAAPLLTLKIRKQDRRNGGKTARPVERASADAPV